MLSRLRSFLGRVARSYVLFVVVGLVVGLALAPLAYDATDGPDTTIAVVPLEGSIDGSSASAVADQLDRARSNPDVAAVVIVSNSGGGTATGSEKLYLAARRTAEEKPLVAAVDASAASGAYYTIAPADYIYTKPSSIVGSIGVRANLPPEVVPNDIVAATGPDKVTGADRREFFYVLESLRLAFLNAVFEHRSDEIELSREEVSQGQIYSGGQAVENGLADAIGDRRSAIREAAQRAEVDSYRVRVYRAGGVTRFISRANYLASTAPDERKEMVSSERYAPTEGGVPTFVMLHGASSGTETATVSAREVTANGTGPAPSAEPAVPATPRGGGYAPA
jgi:protease-4